MKNRIRKIVALLAVSAMAMSILVGCGNTTENSTTNETTTEVDSTTTAEPAAETTEATTELTGTVRLAGSTSMEKVANYMKEDFMEKNPGVTVTVEFSGSSAGVQSLIDGQCDIGDASRGLKDTEKEAGAVENVVAYDGIVAIVNPANSVTSLTTEELAAIYKGEITNWSELGGADAAIVVIGRENGSGTRGAFEELLEVEDLCVMAQELDSNGAVCATVEATAEAIGYASLDIAESEGDALVMMTLNDVAPSVEAIKGGTYPLYRPFVMATFGSMDEQSEVVKAFLDYAFGEEGQAMVVEAGAISIN